MLIERLEQRRLLSVVSVTTNAQLAAAVSSVVSGEQINIAAGNYNGFQLDASGTTAAPIVFNFSSGAIINGTPGTSNGEIDLSGCSYVTINGADVQGSHGARAGIWAGG